MKDVLERLEQKIDAGFVQMDRRFTQVEEGFAQVEERFTQVEERFAQVDGRFAQVDDRFARIEGQLQKQGVLLEKVSSDVTMALEGIAGNRQVLDDKFGEVLRKLDERVQPVELASRYLARQLPALKAKRARRKPSS